MQEIGKEKWENIWTEHNVGDVWSRFSWETEVMYYRIKM